MKSYKSTLLIIALVLLSTSTALAQVNYTFSAVSGTFTALTGATAPGLTGGNLDDGWYDNIPIGFTFTYNSIDYTAISAATNGCFVFGPTLSGNPMMTNNLTVGTPRPVIAPLWDDEEVNASTGVFSYKTEGTSPNRIFTAEWLNMEWNYSAAGPVISFQVKLYEATKVVEFIYRQEANPVNSGSASIGITAVDIGAGNFLSLDGTGTSPNVSSTIETNNLSTAPASGQIYRFTPFAVVPPTITHTALTGTGSTVARLVSATITSSFGIAGGSNAPRVYYRGDAISPYSFVLMTNTSGNIWQANIPGYPVGTTVQYYIAAQDLYSPPNMSTAPSGGSGVNPPGTTPPTTPYSYSIILVNLDYSFEAVSGTFAQLTGATVAILSGGSLDDGYYNNLPIGFAFNYNGIDYTAISAATNGCCVLGPVLGVSMITNNLTSGTPRPVIGPLWDDCDMASGTLSYKTVGTAPNRIFTIEWLNVEWTYSVAGPSISFQVKLYEATSNIEFVYRQELIPASGGSASIGITAVGTGVGNFLSLDGTGTSPNVSPVTEVTTLSTAPATGQIYRFVAIPYPRFTHTPLTNTTSTGTRLVSAVITSLVGLAGSPNQPRTYYRVGTSGDYTALVMTQMTGDTWQATLPGQLGGTLVQYYLAAQDISIPPLVRTAPVGGSGYTPPGSTPPATPYSYYVQGTISGTKYIVNGVTAQDTYPSFTAAINALNPSLVGTGGVTFNVPAGQIFDETPPTLISTGTLGNGIVFQKSGTGANPLVRPSVAGTKTTATIAYNGDAIFKIGGGDYITFNEIDVQDTFSASATVCYEYGYMTTKMSVTDACKNITIRNCNIQLKKTTGYSAGICISNTDNIGTDNITVTAEGGRSENIYIYSNTISNVYFGIVQRGYAHSTSPYNLQDQNIYIGDAGGNSISNYGGGTATTYAFYGIYYNNLKVNNNTIRGGTGTTTITYGIMVSTGYNANMDIINNDISIATSALTNNFVSIYIGGGASGIDNTINVKKNLIHDMTYTTATTGAFYGIYQATSGAINTYIDSNIVRDISHGSATATGAFYGIEGYYSTNQYVRWNQVYNITLNGSGAQSCYPIYAYYGTNKTVTYNTVHHITIIGTGAFYGIDCYYGTNITYSYNKLYNCIRTTGASGAMYFNYPYYSTTLIYSNNEIYNCGATNASNSGSIYAVYAYSSATSANIYNNYIHNIYGGTGAVYGLYSYLTGPTHNVYNNIIDSLSSGGTSVYGLYVNAGAPAYVYNNNIWYLKTTSTSGAVYGLTIAGGTTMNVYNNFVTDLHTPASTSTDAIRGLYISGGTTVNAYYNTVFLNDTSSSATTYGNTAIYASTTPIVTLINNVGVNLSKPGVTAGCVVAYRRSSNVLTTYASVSNNNCFYAGTPGAQNVIYYQAAADSSVTMADYKLRVTPRDGVSVTELPPFVNVATRPYNIHINSAIATRLESGGQPIAGITTDIDGDTRAGGSKLHNNVAPDLGADEFLGIAIDENGPMITYTLLPYTSSLANRTLTALITDPISGVSVQAGRRPTLFFNKNRGTWYQDSLNASPWTFTIDVTKIGGVVVGDSVFYYVQAYDSSGNVSVNPGTAPTTPNFYIITAASLAGNYTVGLAEFNRLTGRNIYFERSVRKVTREIQVPDIMPSSNGQISSALDKNSNAQTNDAVEIPTHIERVVVDEIYYIPMENGKVYTGDLYVKKSEHPEIQFPRGTDADYATITAAVADLNLRGVSSATTFLLVDASYPSETYPIIINVANEMKPTALKTVTIKPNTGMTVVIAGASAASQIFRIVSSYVTIDGSNSAGGTSRDLTIQNTSTTTPQVISVTPSGTTPTVSVTIKNCILINGVNTSSAVVVGNPGFFNNITFQNNNVQKAYIGIYVLATVVPGNGSGTVITGNDFNTLRPNNVTLTDIYVQGVDGVTVTNNNISIDSTTYTGNITGVWFATGTTNSTISRNTIGPINITTAPPRGIAISTGVTNSNITISNNIITSLITSYGGAEYGIYIFSTTTGVVVTNNKISTLFNSSTGGYSAVGIALAVTVSAANVTVSNNFIWDVAAYGYGSSTTDNGYGIWIMSGDGYKIYYNSINLATNSTSSSAIPACLIINSAVTTAGALDIRNNIFAIPATVGTNRYAVLCNAASAVFSNIDYNDYITSGPNLGYIGSTRADLTAWRTGTGRDVHSVSADPIYTSASDLHIPLTVLSPVNRAATPISGITNDIDDEARNTTFPDIGADEYTPNAPSTFSLITPLNGQIDLPRDGGQLVWNKATLAQYYDVLLDTVPQPVNKVSRLQIDTTYTYSGLLRAKTYYWQVIAYNDTNPVSDPAISSEIWHFTTINIDVGCTKIMAPTGTFDSIAYVVPACSVYNYGTTMESYTVRMKIGVIYNNAVPVTDHASHTYKHITFPNWVVQRGFYAVSCSTELETDMEPNNDKATNEVTVTVKDVATTMLVSPTGTLLHGTIYPVHAKVKNLGTDVASFTARFKIGTIYNNVVTVSQLASGEEREIAFPDWQAVECSYATSCSTELATDQVNGNNKLLGSITVQRHDVAPVAIMSPSGTAYGGNNVIPRVKVKNYGYHTTETFTVTFKIGTVYTNTKTVTNLGPRDSTYVLFDVWQAVIGLYDITTYSSLATDQTTSNDTLHSSIEVSPPVDNVGTVEILAPLDTIPANVPVIPSAIVRNYGSSPATFTVRFRIGTLYNQVVTVTSLDSNAQTTVVFPSWNPVPCNYVASCSTEYAIDFIPENDKLETNITVQYRDVGVVTILAPRDTVITCNDYTPTVLVSNNGIHVYAEVCTVAVRITRFPIQMISYCNVAVDTLNPITVYDTFVLAQIPAGQIDYDIPVTLPIWHPYWWDLYWLTNPSFHRVTATVKMAADMNSANNTLTSAFVVEGRSNDIQMSWTGVLDGYMPMHAETIGIKTYNVSSVVATSSGENDARFRAWAKIIKEDDNTIVYSRYEDVTMPPETYYCVPFQSGWSATDPGWYKVESWIQALPQYDAVTQNNSWVKRYYVTNLGPITRINSEINPSVQGNTMNIPNTFGLMANKPNPFSTHTTIYWQIPIASNVTITIYDATGRNIKTLVNGQTNPGTYSTSWNRMDNNNQKVAAGIYFYEMRADNYIARHKMVINN